MPILSNHHIASIHLINLFGRYTYEIPAKNEKLSDLNILYGENGLGKTTLLSLVFHLLSPARNRSHKTTISKIPFHQLIVKLHDGTIISAEKDPQLLIGPCNFRIGSGDTVAEWRFVPGERAGREFDDISEDIEIESLPSEVKESVRQALLQRKFFKILSELQAAPFMLTADRILLGDSVENPRDSKRLPDTSLPRSRLNELVADYRIAAVEFALSSASIWLQRKFLEGSYSIDESSGGVYRDVIKRIATTPYTTRGGLGKQAEIQRRASLVNSIDEINTRARRLAAMGYGRNSIHSSIRDYTIAATGNKLQLIENVLAPHLDELRIRVDAMEPAYKTARTFIENLNQYLKDKRARLSLRSGIEIFSKEDVKEKFPIAPSQLSSGEQQLLLIFCQVLMAKDKPNIFIIDEPEISLNILWQRMLINSLKQIAEDSETQFLFASHSMEILAKHSDRVVTLDAL